MTPWTAAYEVLHPWDFPGKSTGVGCHVDHNKLWKVLKEMGIPDHLICLLRNLYAGQEATLRTGHGTTDWFQIGKGVHQGCIGEGNGNPLQYSCLENPRDGGAWWAAVYGVAQSRHD